MSYQLNKTNGNVLTNLVDGRVDTFSTDLTLVGRNFSGYGEHINENFIALLENFSNTTPPQNPLEGQLWWNFEDKRLEVFNGEDWSISGAPIVQTEEPALVAGDLWIDSGTRQLKANDGSSTFLVGPGYTQSQGTSGFVIESFRDILGNDRTVSSIYNAGQRIAITSNAEFTLDQNVAISGLDSNVVPRGITPLGTNRQWFNGVAKSASALFVADDLPLLVADQVMRNDEDNTTIGSIVVNNNNGITIGQGDNIASHRILFEESEFSYVINSERPDQNIVFRVESSAYSGEVDALRISPASPGIAIYGDDPLAELHVYGSEIVERDLYVYGDEVVFEVDTFWTSSNKLELGVYRDGSVDLDEDVDGAGLFVRAENSDKTLTWSHDNQSWTASHSIDTSESYKVNGVEVLTGSSLSGVSHATDLQEIGTLDYLNVAELSLDQNYVESSGDLVLRSTSAVFVDTPVVEVGGAVIEGVGTPVNSNDAVNKQYVDSSVQLADVAMSLDITGLGNSNETMEEAVASFLADLIEPVSAFDGRIARIHGVDHDSSEPERKLITYVCNSNAWVWQNTVDY